jgi:hypothetical protein
VQTNARTGKFHHPYRDNAMQRIAHHLDVRRLALRWPFPGNADEAILALDLKQSRIGSTGDRKSPWYLAAWQSLPLANAQSRSMPRRGRSKQRAGKVGAVSSAPVLGGSTNGPHG